MDNIKVNNKNDSVKTCYNAYMQGNVKDYHILKKDLSPFQNHLLAIMFMRGILPSFISAFFQYGILKMLSKAQRFKRSLF